MPITEAHSFEFGDIGPALEEDPAFGDTWTTQLAGLLSWSWTAEANWDTAQSTVFDAATQNLGPVRFYGYPDQAVAARFYSGLVWVAFSGGGAVDAKGNISISATGDGPLVAA